MKQLHQVTLYSKRWIAQDTVEMILQSKELANNAQPGQFLHIRVPGHTLRRPISIAHIDLEQQLITILFKMIGSGTERLSTYVVGDDLDVLGPLGKGFPLDQQVGQTALLIGGGIGIPPLYALGTALSERGVHVKTILGYQTKSFVFYEEQFARLGETIVVTDDGSYGEKGLVTDVIQQIGPFDEYYSCGPKPMLRAVMKELTTVQGHVSLEERMGCGVGACFACVIPTIDEQDYKKICQDGPVFSAKEVVL